MLSGATRMERGQGAARNLAKHLSKTMEGGKRQEVRVDPGRGVSGATLGAQLRSLWAGAADLPSRRPIYHIHLDPALGEGPEARALFWAKFEEEFDLSRARFASTSHVLHTDWRAEHEHRTYELRSSDGRLAKIGNDYLRRQRIVVEVAFELGLAVPPIAKPEAVARWLEANGKDAVAAWMRSQPAPTPLPESADFPEPANDTADLPEPAHDTAPATRRRLPSRVSSLTPRERQQQERTEVRKLDTAAAVVAAWERSDDGPSFLAALRDQGLRVAMGDKGVPVVLDVAGGSHNVGRLLAAGLKDAGKPSKGMQAAGNARLAGVALSPVAEVRRQPVPAQAEPPQAATAAAAPASMAAVPAMGKTVTPEVADAAPADLARLPADVREAITAR